MSRLEDQLVLQIHAAGLPAPAREHAGIPGRRFRFDLAWPDRMLAVEVQGGIWIQGRHSGGRGQEADLEKLSLAAVHGWRVLQVTGRQIRDGRAIRWVREVLR